VGGGAAREGAPPRQRNAVGPVQRRKPQAGLEELDRVAHGVSATSRCAPNRTQFIIIFVYLLKI
jgi:hypothetical protein